MYLSWFRQILVFFLWFVVHGAEGGEEYCLSSLVCCIFSSCNDSWLHDRVQVAGATDVVKLDDTQKDNETVGIQAIKKSFLITSLLKKIQPILIRPSPGNSNFRNRGKPKVTRYSKQSAHHLLGVIHDVVTFLSQCSRLSTAMIFYWRNRRQEYHSTSVGQLVRTFWTQDMIVPCVLSRPVAISSWSTTSLFSSYISSTYLFVCLEMTIHERNPSFFKDSTWISTPCAKWFVTLTSRVGPIFVCPRIQSEQNSPRFGVYSGMLQHLRREASRSRITKCPGEIFP